MRGSHKRSACGYPSPVSPSLRDVDPPSPTRGEGEVSQPLLSRTQSQRRGKIRDIDQSPRVAAFADAAALVERFDLEADHAALDRDHLCGGAHGDADRRRGEMLDVDLGADGDPAGF